MDELWRWISRIRDLAFKGKADRESREEMQFHIDMEIQERIRLGMSPAEARRSALLDFGGVERYREQVRERRWGHTIDLVLQDVRYAVRTFARSPVFTTVALLTLTLGIGGATAIFSLVDAVLLSPLPYDDPGRILRIQQSWAGTPEGSISPAEHLDYMESLDVFTSVGSYAYGSSNLTGDSDPQRVSGAQVSAGVFPALGIAPQRGRVFTEAEDHAGTAVVVISDALWRGRFGSDDRIVGRTITMDGQATEVIGVLPPGFRMPELLLTDGQTHYLEPLNITPDQVEARGSHYLRGVGRLGPGIPRTEAERAVAQAAADMVRAYPDDYPADMRFGATVIPLSRQIRGPVRLPLLILLGAVGLVLLIACANVANLLISRADQRERELAMRAALGAGRRRLVSQVLIESTVLSVAGGVLGFGLAAVILRISAGIIPSGLAWLERATLDGRVLAFAIGAALLTGVVFGMLPAGRIVRGNLGGSLREGGGRVSGDRGGLVTRRLLVVGELALALVLLAGAGLLTRSFIALVNVDPGIRTDQVASARVTLPIARYQSDEEIRAFHRELRTRLNAVPGVLAAAAVSNLPLATTLGDLNFRIEGRPVPEGGVSPRGDWQVVTPGYFEAMGLAVVQGREIAAHDDTSAPGVVVVNQTLARLHWPDGDAIGKRFTLGGQAGPGIVEIVGVVRDVRHEGLEQPDRPQMYLAHEQFRFWNGGGAARAMNILVHSSLPLSELADPMRDAVRSLDPLLPLSDFTTMREARAGAVAIPRLLMSLVAGFSLLSLILAAVGIYGVMAFAVGRRTHEFGIRMALGARPMQVSGMVLRQGLGITTAGIAFGLVGVYVSTRLLSTVLFGVTATDPVTLAAVAILLGSVAVAACWIPAHRATTVSPVVSLRAE